MRSEWAGVYLFDLYGVEDDPLDEHDLVAVGYLAVFVLPRQQEPFLVLSRHLHLIDYNFKLNFRSLFSSLSMAPIHTDIGNCFLETNA